MLTYYYVGKKNCCSFGEAATCCVRGLSIVQALRVASPSTAVVPSIHGKNVPHVRSPPITAPRHLLTSLESRAPPGIHTAPAPTMLALLRYDSLHPTCRPDTLYCTVPCPLALAGRSTSLELRSVTNVTNQPPSRRTASHVAGGGGSGSRSICHAFPDLDSHSVLYYNYGLV